MFISQSILSSLLAAPMSLKCESLYFDEAVNKVIAKDNVLLTLDNATIRGESLSFYLDDNIVLSSGNVQISRNDESFQSSSLYLNLSEKSLRLTDINISITPPKSKGKIYIKIQDLVDKSQLKIGSSAYFTTCPDPSPHHYLHVWKFMYYPDKSIHLFGGYFRNDFTFFPFNWIPIPVPLLELTPVPYYYYQLGKRERVLNFPVIGKKKTDGWGWFLQNSYDYRYKNNKESTLYVDWYEAKSNRSGEWGYGIKHHYGGTKHFGYVYAYNYDYMEGDTEKKNLIYDINHQFTFDNMTIKGNYKKIDVDERINSRGSEKSLKKSLSVDHDPQGFPLKLSLSESQNFKSNYHELQSSVKKRFLYDSIDISLKESRYKSTNRERLSTKFKHSKTLKHNIKFDQTVDYFQQDSTDDQLDPDQTLKYNSSLKASLPHDIKLTMYINYFKDLDEDRVTSDSKSSVNNYLFKLPEIELKKSNYSLLFLKSSTTFRTGYYKEVKYSSSEGGPFEYPTLSDGVEPNVYYFKQSFSKSVKKLPLNSHFSFSTDYEQYVFKNKDTDLFKGDSQYSFGSKSSLESTFFKFIKLKSSYSSKYAPVENNSPFHAFRKSFPEKNEIAETLTFFYKQKAGDTFYKPAIDFSWKHSTGYNWHRDSKPYNDYKSSLNLSINKRYKLKASMGQKLNFQPHERLSKYSPLLINLNLKSKFNHSLNYSISYDMNNIVFEEEWTVKSSSFTISFPLGLKKDFRWNIKSNFKYNSEGIGKPIEWRYYELQTLSITKKEHRRKFELGYKKLIKEWFFKYTFDLFPDDPLVIRKKEDIITFEGRFSKKSEERFK